MFFLNGKITTMNPIHLKIPMPQLDYINYTKNTTGSEGMSSSFSTTSLNVEVNSAINETEGLLEDQDMNLNDEYEGTFIIEKNTIGTTYKSRLSTTST